MRSAIAFFPLLLLLLIGTAAALIYFIIYKRKINRIVMSQNDSDDPDAFTAGDAAGPEPSSVADKLFKAGALIIIVVLLIKLSNANSNLNALTYNVNNLTMDVRTLRATVDSLSTAAAAASSNLADFDFSLGEFNSADNTVELKLTATPKVSSPDTKVSVSLGDLTAELTRGAGSSYAGAISVNIFEELPDYFTFYITDGDSTVSENCPSYLGAIWPKVLPCASVMANGTTSAKEKIKLDLDIDIRLNNTDFASYNRSGIRMVETLGSEVLSDKDISSDITWSKDEGSYRFSLKKKIADTVGQDYRIILYADDTAGYRHEITVISLSDDEALATAFYNDMIYDASGSLLNEDSYYFD